MGHVIIRYEGLLKVIVEGRGEETNHCGGRPHFEYIREIIKDQLGCVAYVQMKWKEDHTEKSGKRLQTNLRIDNNSYYIYRERQTDSEYIFYIPFNEVIDNFTKL